MRKIVVMELIAEAAAVNLGATATAFCCARVFICEDVDEESNEGS
eukprot:CAMPEP_0172299914 /NCGR_PEP_ID=MMETSP1058-20130122/2101_1 /TAXON_ID=83371 /ORGANISM="Detonula confervacea, Strain CCMP 353" /LENGTH=44 /DNA_ID= /DNA_START= /DNA_END= /DNA_ORIENTATION=